LEELQRKYLPELKIYEEHYGIEHNYPKALELSYEKEIKNKIKDLKNGTFKVVAKQREVAFTENDQKAIVKALAKVQSELEYLSTLIPKYDSQIERVIEQLVCIVSDLLVEVSERLRDEALACFPVKIRPLVKILIKTRNQLCHDTFLVDRELFMRIIKDTVGNLDDFKAFYLEQKEKVPLELIEDL